MPRYQVNMELVYTQDAWVDANSEEDALEKLAQAIFITGNLTDIQIDPPEFSQHRDEGTWIATLEEE